MIAGRVGGIETLFVLDTGSEVHLLTRELADRVGLEGVPGEAGTDHAGATLASWDIGSVELRVGGADDTALMLGDVVAIPAPRPFPDWGVGGILSPQHLHPTASIVMDLRADELVLVEGSDDDLRSWLATRGSDLDLLALPRDAAFPSLVVPAAIDPHPELPVMLNTGGKHTEFLAEAAPGVDPRAARADRRRRQRRRRASLGRRARGPARRWSAAPGGRAVRPCVDDRAAWSHRHGRVAGHDPRRCDRY